MKSKTEVDMMSRNERVEDALEYLWKCVNRLPTKLRSLCIKVLENEDWLKGYGASVGTPHAHHAYPGGLVVHTAEVLENALRMANSEANQHADQNVITTAVVFHDVMKIADSDSEGKKTEYTKLIYHIAGSCIKFACWADDINLQEELVTKISHAILAHHGRKEWGSPVEPETIEALIVHQADLLSCRYGMGR
jgi:3'-5' exoribonuclease